MGCRPGGGREAGTRVALELRAKIVVWGSFQRQSNQWTVDAQVLNTNSAAGPVQIKITSPDLARLPEQAATNLAGHLNRPIAEGISSIRENT